MIRRCIGWAAPASPLALGALVGGVFLWVLVGCGSGPPVQVQHALSAAALGVVAADEAVAPRYRAAAEACYTHSTNRAQYDQCTAEWDHVVDALEAVAGALRVAQLGRDAWARGADDGLLRGAVPCLAAALGELALALELVGLELPEGLHSAFQWAHTFAGECADDERD